MHQMQTRCSVLSGCECKDCSANGGISSDLKPKKIRRSGIRAGGGISAFDGTRLVP